MNNVNEPTHITKPGQSTATYSPPENNLQFALRDDLNNLQDDFEKLEKRIDRANNFMMWVVGGVGIAFISVGIVIILDYLHNNNVTYEKFIDKTQEIQNNTETNVRLELKSFKDCVWQRGLERCLN